MARLICRLVFAVAATAVIGAAVLVYPTPAWACTCAPTTIQQSLDAADAVFEGTVTRSDRVGHGSSARVELRFQVSRVFKGRVYADQVVVSAPDSAGCGIDAAVGSGWVIFATTSVQGSGDRLVSQLTSSQCSGNLPDAASTPAVLGRGTLPVPGASDTLDRSFRADERVDRTLQIAGLGALGLLVLGGLALVLVWRRPPSVQK